jgi:predicted amidophosphoribosyltransferase
MPMSIYAITWLALMLGVGQHNCLICLAFMQHAHEHICYYMASTMLRLGQHMGLMCSAFTQHAHEHICYCEACIHAPNGQHKLDVV